jgi:hypothetical protein
MTIETYGVDESRLQELMFPTEGMMDASLAGHPHEHANVLELETAAHLVHLAGQESLDDLPVSPSEAEDTTSMLRRLSHMRTCEPCIGGIARYLELFPRASDFNNVQPL